MAELKKKDVKSLSDTEIIFSSIFTEDDLSGYRRIELVKQISAPEMFSNEAYVFYLITQNFPNVTPNADFVNLYLRTNRANFSNSAYIDMSEYMVGETDPYVEFANSCVETFKACAGRTVSDSDFHRSIEMHKMQYLNKASIEILEKSVSIIADGVSERGKMLNGYEDMRDFSRHQFSKLDALNADDERKGIVVYGQNDEEEEIAGKMKLVTKFGLEELDKEIGGIYSGDMVSILAPAKGGKSRWSTAILHTAIVEFGQSVVMWSVENGYKGWEALIRARHFEWLYNSQVTDIEQKIIIDADMIRKGEFPSPKIEEMELASWADLKTNTAYGRIANMDEDFDFDTALQKVDEAVKAVNATLICVDYLQLISGGKNTTKNERIGEAYKMFLQFLKKRKIAGIFPGQLKQTAVGEVGKKDSADLINMELRDAAGESYEVIKTPDVNLMLYGTTEDIRNGDMKIISIPSRNSKPFEPIDVVADLGTCTFTSIPR